MSLILSHVITALHDAGVPHDRAMQVAREVLVLDEYLTLLARQLAWLTRIVAVNAVLLLAVLLTLLLR